MCVKVVIVTDFACVCVRCVAFFYQLFLSFLVPLQQQHHSYALESGGEG